MAKRNPFTPTFGKIPPYLAGRDKVILEITQAFENGAGDPNLSSIFVGSRGTGKTALLFYLSQEASQKGWISVNVSAVPGMLDDILEQTEHAASHILTPQSTSKLKGVGIGQLVNVEWDNKETPQGNWRTRMSNILEQLNKQDVGLLITVDEVNAGLPEMIQLATIYQHFVGEDRKVALLMAGLPTKVSSLIRNDSISFLRRACKHTLERIPDAEVAYAIQHTIEEAGRQIDKDAIEQAVCAICGFPYMLQLVGFRMWGQRPNAESITKEDACAAIALAKKDFSERVLDATYYDLSDGDIRVLGAMLEDSNESRLTDISKRLGESSGYISTYKRRLIEQGVIGERGKKVVAFELPGFREYLEERLSL